VVVTHSQELADGFPHVLRMEDGALRPPGDRPETGTRLPEGPTAGIGMPRSTEP
jgi:hypothetical protein